jgi:hypothetical protein
VNGWPCGRLSTGRRAYIVAALLLVTAFAAANRKFLVGEYFPIWDAEGLFAPYFVLIADFARHGELLWWNPWAGGGQPDFIDQYGAHNPVVVALAWLLGPTVQGFIYYWFALWLLFGLGIIALARCWGVPAWGAYVVALGLMFSGFHIGNAEHTSVLFAWAWLPATLWRLEVALTKGSLSAATQSGLLFGLSALGGYPAVVFTNAVFLAFWIAARLLLQDDAGQTRLTRPGERWWTAASSAALLFGVASLIAASSYINFFREGRGFTPRVGDLSRAVAVDSNALHPRALLTFSSPYLATLPTDRLWDYTDISSCSVYSGGLVFGFALFSIFARPRSRFRWALLAASAFAVAASLGRELPVRGLLYDWVAPTRLFRHASWFRAYPIMIGGILALYGIRDLATGVPGSNCRRRWLLATIISALAASLAYRAVLDRARPADHLAGDVHFVFAWAGPVLIGLWMATAPRASRRAFIAVAFCALATVDGVLAVGLANTLANVGERYRGAWAVLERHHRHGVDLLQLGGARRKPEPEGGPYNNTNLITRRAVLLGYSGLVSTTQKEWMHEPVLVASATSEDRFWFAAHPVLAPPAPDLFHAFVQRSKQLGAPPFVLHPREAMTMPAPTSPEQIGRVRAAPAAMKAAVVLERYLPDSLVLHFDAPRDGWLLVTDRWASGWTARVNGARVRVEGGDFLFRAVHVRGGRNRIEFTYRPFGRPWLVFVSVVVMLAVMVGGILGWRHRRAEMAQRCDAYSPPLDAPG